MNWIVLGWLAAALALLLLIERWIHRHLQGLMLLLTGDPDITVVLYALPLLPGIAVHEVSHALSAVLLGVRVGRISIRPKRAGQRVQLGFVPVEKTDAVRASLIGLAPLLTGCALILLVGYFVFDLGAMELALAMGDWDDLVASVLHARRVNNAWLWAYVVFTVSNTMLPSRADRQAWTPIIIFLLLLGVAVWVVGLGPVLIASVSGSLIAALRWLTVIFALTILIDLPFVLVIAVGERLVGRLKGMRVEY